MTRHSVRAGPALRAMNEADPAVAALALWCDHRDAASGPPAETAGSTIRYGLAFDSLPRHEQIGLAAHHVLHVALRHGARLATMAARMGDRFDRDLYIIAADAIVNEALLAAGHALPRPALTLTGLLAAAQIPFASAAAALAEWDTDRLYIRLRQQGGGEGSAADRAKAHARDRGFSPDVTPEAAEAGDRGAGEEARWRQHVARAMDGGRRAGRGVGLLGNRLADLPLPSTPWEVILRRLVTRAVLPGARHSHIRPSRAWIAMETEARRGHGPEPAFQPGLLRSTDAPRIAVALDSSSSIDDARLALFMAEISGIARRCVADLHVILFDEMAQSCVRLDPARWQSGLAALTPPRGGGTSFVPALDRALALAPSVIVVLTDLEGDFGPAPRRIPVIWAVPDALAPPPPPFGTLLSLAR